MPRQNHIRYISFFICLGFVILIKGQSTILSKNQEQALVVPVLNTANQFPNQQIYLQTDKDIYETQENVWFHAVLKNAHDLSADDRSKVFFLTLLNSENEVIVKAKFPIKDAIVQGRIYLQEFLTPGIYHLVGYTKHAIQPGQTFYKTIKRLEIKETLIPKVLISYEQELLDLEKLQVQFKLTSRSGAVAKKTKLRLKGISSNGESVLAKTITDSTGKAIITIDIKKASAFKNFLCEVIDKKKNNQRTPIFLSIDDLKTPEIHFYPESDSLTTTLNQNIGFKAILKNGRPTNFQGLLREDNVPIDTVKTSFYGMGSFKIKPKPNKNYSIQSLSDPTLIFELPKATKNGAIFSLQNLDQQHADILFQTTDLSFYKGEIFIRVQSKGSIHWMGKGNLIRNEQLLSIPIDRAPPGIVEVAIFDKNLQLLFSRLLYVHAGNKLYVEQLNSLEDSYSPRSKVVIQLKIKDRKNLPKKAKLSMRVFDHLYDDVVQDRNIASYFLLESNLKENISKPGIYFKNNLNGTDSLNLLLLNIKPDTYIWSASNQITKHGKFDIQEDIVGKVMVKTKSGTLKSSGVSDIQLFNSNGVSLHKTNENGMFRITKEVLNYFRGESLFVKTTVADGVIKILDNDNNIFGDSKITLEYPEVYTLQNFEKNSQLEDQIRSFNLNSMNYLDEVVVKAQYKNRGKNAAIYGLFAGNVYDYVCVEYNILNCINHKQGYAPIDGEFYRDNYGTLIQYKAPERKESPNNKPKDFVLINSFYSDKKFEDTKYIDSSENFDFDNRKTLHWETDIATDNEGKATITFFTSDNRGVYKGFVDVYTDDGLFGVYEFSVNVY
ncbi:hypothetical protein ABN763_05125 [Spongiivirga sp. MCCC 1A20706]|uniref:hypothetical protein n=1 Tax=Spongiivirga sp. MCCC 1A20706 TaxID=3160963 RepID=UPI0039773237